MHKKILLLLLASSLILSACQQAIIGEKEVVFNPNQTIEAPEAKKNERVKIIKIPCSYQDENNSPWKFVDNDTKISANLIFDSLINLSIDYKIEYALAKSITTTDNKTFLIELNPNASFTDSTPLIADYVVSSISSAMAKSSDYSSVLSNISSHKKIDNLYLQIILSKPDANFPNLLTFPIVKSTPSGYIGTGRYVYRTRDEKGIQLERNPDYWGPIPSIPTILLVDLPKQELASYSLKIGNVDCMYNDLSTSDTLSISSSNYPIDINHILFLGVNCVSGKMVSLPLRQAVNSAIDRDFLVESVYSARATAAYSPFNPNFYKAANIPSPKQDQTVAKQILQEAFEDDIPKLRLLYNLTNNYHKETANQIAGQLEEVGIEVELLGKKYDAYMSALNSGSYDLYIAELKIPDNMDLSYLITRGENHGFGLVSFNEFNEKYAAAMNGTGSYEDAASSFNEYLPLIPLLYRQGIFAFSREMALNVIATHQDIFYNIDEWQ